MAGSSDARIARIRDQLFEQCRQERWQVFFDDTVRAETAAKLIGQKLRTLEHWRTQRDSRLPWKKRKWPVYPLRGIAEYLAREEIDPESP